MELDMLELDMPELNESDMLDVLDVLELDGPPDVVSGLAKLKAWSSLDTGLK